MKPFGWGRKEVPHDAPLLSVIIPAYKAEKFLDECLNSLRAQRLSDIEVVVVDDGSPDRSAQITKKHAKADPRIRLLTRPNGGSSAARMTGIERSRGRYITFVDADDIVTVDGFAAAVESLESSGSDWAPLPYRQFSNKGLSDPPGWIDHLFAAGTRTVAPADCLEAMVHTIAASKVYRRAFWDEAGLAFRPGVLYEDQEVLAIAFASARSIDVVAVEAYLWRLRGGSRSNEATGHSMSHFFKAVHHSLGHLAAVEGAVAERSRQLLANDIPRYLRALAKVDDPGYADELFKGIRFLWPNVSTEAWLRETPAEAKVMESLVVAGRESDVATFIDAGGIELAKHPFVQLHEGPALKLPFFDDESIERSAFVLSERQTPADARALRVVLDEAGVNLEFMAYLRHLDTGQPEARAWLYAGDREMGELALRRVDAMAGHRTRTTRASNERSIWSTRFEWPDVALLDDPNAELTVRIEVSHLGRTASTTLSLIDPAGSAAWPQQAAGWEWTATEPARWSRLGPKSQPVPALPDDVPVPFAQLPLDTPDGWWGFDQHRAIVWTALPEAEREQATVWWQRENSAAG